MKAHLRVARDTDQLEVIASLYERGLDFERLGAFEDHEGFDGVLLGSPGAEYHLEFIHRRGHTAPKSNSEEQLLVFYVPDPAEYDERLERLAAAGFERVPATNPYWDRDGASFRDPDGFRVVIARRAWPPR